MRQHYQLFTSFLTVLLLSQIEKLISRTFCLETAFCRSLNYQNGREGFEGAPRIFLDEILVDRFSLGNLGATDDFLMMTFRSILLGK